MTNVQPSYPFDWFVPKGTFTSFFDKKHKYAVVIPVINEGSRLLRQLESMSQLRISSHADILIADGGSTDGSTDLDSLQGLGIRALIVKKDTGKLSSQLQMAYAFALLEGYDGIVTVDGNGKDGVEAIFDFLTHLEQGYDLVHGSRFVKGGRAVRTPFLRYFAIRAFHAPLISLSARSWLTDTTNGFRGYSRKYLLHPGVRPFRKIFKTYELLAYLSARASQLNLRTIEIPVTREYPKNSPTPTKIKGLNGYFALLHILLRQLLGEYEPQG